MATTEQRVALLEGRLMEQTQVFADIRDVLARLERRVDAGFDRVDARFGQVDARFGQVDARFGQVDDRIDAIRKDAIVDFRWIVGIQVTTLVAMVATLLAR